MARLQRVRSHTSTRALAGVLSVLLHVLLIALIAWSGGRGDGTRENPAPAMQAVWLLGAVTAARADLEASRWTPDEPPSLPPPVPATLEFEPPAVALPKLDLPRTEAEPAMLAGVQAAPDRAVGTASTFAMAGAQASRLLQRIEQLAEGLAETPQLRVTWQQDGRRYDAVLAIERGRHGIEPERVVAQVSVEEQGRPLHTRMSLKRLPFSHYAQFIDRWDPMVQLHDDEIGGRMHVNSRFNVLYDAQAAPRLRGKVTTAAGDVRVERRDRRGDAAIFLEGIETGTRPIAFSGRGWTLEEALRDADARVHRFAADTRIRFVADGGYLWRDAGSDDWQRAEGSGGEPVFLVGTRRARLHVQGVVSGKFLVYSPDAIVIEGDLVYAQDPRIDPDLDDYLGLVSDRDIVVAPPYVTGPGDLDIHAALFARRRLIVTAADHPRPANLRIFGSLAAGTLTESEPRYATKVEYDPRFERLRPPEFPSTDRFAVDAWDGTWTAEPEATVHGGS
jgi:hypothetical protein